MSIRLLGRSQPGDTKALVARADQAHRDERAARMGFDCAKAGYKVAVRSEHATPTLRQSVLDAHAAWFTKWLELDRINESLAALGPLGTANQWGPSRTAVRRGGPIRAERRLARTRESRPRTQSRQRCARRTASSDPSPGSDPPASLATTIGRVAGNGDPKRGVA
jgi:hypothetical protein